MVYKLPLSLEDGDMRELSVCTDPTNEDVNDAIANKNVFTKMMSKSTGFPRIIFNGFARSHWQTGYYPVAYGWCLGLF